MADIRLALQVDSSGAIQSVKTFNDEVAKIPAKASGASSSLGSLGGAFGSLSSSLAMGGGFALAQKGIEGVISAVRTLGPDLIATGSASANATRSFQSLASAVGISSQAMLGKAREGTRGLVSDLDLMGAANKALLLGLPVTAQGFGTLAQAATALGRAMGQDATKSLDDLITGLGRGSAQILDNLGIVVNAEQAQKDYAATLGKTTAELTDAEKKTAVYNAALVSMGANVEKLGGIQLTLADRMQQVRVTFQNVYAAAGQAIVQSPAVVAAFEAIAAAVTGAFGQKPSDMVTKFTEYFNTFAIAAVDGAKLAVGALHTIGLGLVNLTRIMVATNPFLAFNKSLKDSLEQQAKIYQGSYTEQMNFLDELQIKMKRNIETQAKLNAMTGNKPAPGGGGGGGGSTGVGQSAGVKSLLDSAFHDIYDVWVKGSDRLWDAITGKGSAAIGVLNQAANQRFAFDAINGGGRSVFGASERVWDSVTNPGKGMLETLFPDFKKQKEASMTASQALQNLANIASLSGSKLAKGLAGIFGGASGISSGLSGLKDIKGGGLTGILGKAGAWGSIAASALSIGSSIFGMFKKKPKEPAPEPPKQATAEAWRGFVTEQQSKGAAGVLAGVSGIKITSEADMAAQASIASQTFWATFKTQGLIKAADAFKGVRDKMLETFKGFGASEATINALLGPMSQMVDLAGNESFRGAADGANGYAEALASIVNTQMPMSIDQFKAFEQQAVSGFEQMKQAALDQGMTMSDAIRTAAQGSGQYLQTIKDAAARYGFNLGDSQQLFDAAAGAGVAFGGSSEERLIMSIDRLTETLGGAPPKFEAAFSAAGSAAGDRIGAAAQAGQAGTFNPADMGASIVSGLGAAIERLRGDLKSQPIEITLPDINLDGNALASGLAVVVDRGTGGGQRLQTALEGR